MYWKDRVAEAQNNLQKKTEKEIRKELARYYNLTLENTVGQFMEIHHKVFSGMVEGINPTPADLYKLDAYWKIQATLKEELNQMGAKQIGFLTSFFTDYYTGAYNSLALIDPTGSFNTIDPNIALQVINSIWCADGKSWSDRVWDNVGRLQQTLNDNLIDCVITGKSSDELKQILIEDFNVSYNRADTLVKTELSHIQNQAAQQRYADMGATEVEVWAEEDERQCKICGKLHQTKYPINGAIPIPAHPRCRCTIVPVIK